MSQSYGQQFPTQGINPGHIHVDERVSPGRAYMYIGGDPTDLVNNWTEVDLANGPNIFAKLNANSKVPSTDVEVASIGAIITQDQLSSHVLSSGLISGGTVTDAGSETVNISACRAMVRSADNALATLYYVICDAVMGTAIPTNTTRYIHLNYNNGVPSISADTSYDHDVRNRVYLAEVHNVGGALTIHNDPMIRGDFTYRLHQYIEELIGNRVASGESVSETGTRSLIVTAGVIWDRHINEVTTSAFDSSGSDTFTNIYRSATPGEFIEVSGQTQWDNTQYDAGSGSLATLTGGTYGVHFIIRGFDGTIGVMYGTAEYATQALAEAAATPTLRPEHYDEHGIFIAQLVFLKSAASAASITSIKPIIGSSSTSGSGAISLPLAVVQGGTGATTAAGARTNLGLGSVTNDAQLKRSAADFDTFSEKTKPGASDWILIEDGADSNAKKKLYAGNFMFGDQVAPTWNANLTIDWSLGSTQYVTLTAATNITFSGLVDGQVYRLVLIQGGAGGHTASWISAIKWPGAVVPTLTAVAGQADIVTLVRVNGVTYADARLNF